MNQHFNPPQKVVLILSSYDTQFRVREQKIKDSYCIEGAQYFTLYPMFLPNSIRGMSIHTIIENGVKYEELTGEEQLSISSATNAWRNVLPNCKRVEDMIFDAEDILMNPIKQPLFVPVEIKVKAPQPGSYWIRDNELCKVITITNQDVRPILREAFPVRVVYQRKNPHTLEVEGVFDLELSEWHTTWSLKPEKDYRRIQNVVG